MNVNSRGQRHRQIKQRAALASAMGAMVFVGGCAVHPQPIDMQQRRDALPAERAALVRNQPAIDAPVTLDEAMTRALKYNLDYRIKAMEDALANQQLNLANFDLLPRMTLAAGYSDRNNENASSSRSILTGRQSLEPSVSTEEDRGYADLTLSWNVLDFGVSYFQARQFADRVLVAEERRRKAAHLVMQQVRFAWWQAAGAQQLEGKIAPLLARARAALDDSRRVETERLQPPLDALNYQRQLLDIIRQLEALNAELSQAKPRLASLMNLPPGTPFQLSAPGDLSIPAIDMPLEQLEETALLNRPEMMEARYNERISALETRKAIARLFPGVEFQAGAHYDSNSYLVNDQWRDVGARVAWNLLNVLNYRNVKRSAELQKEIAEHQKLALSMAVLTQTQVAYRDYLDRKRQFELFTELDEVEQRILQHTSNAAQSDAQGKLQEVRAAASALIAEQRRYQSYGALQGVYGQVLATLGVDQSTDHLARTDPGPLAPAGGGALEKVATAR